MVQMDADFSHDPADLPRLIEAAGDADLVVGSRYVTGGPGHRLGAAPRAISRWGAVRPRRARPGGPRHDQRLQVLASRGARGDRPRLGRVARLRVPGRDDVPRRSAGFTVVEVPITFRDRSVGESKMTGAIVAEAARVASAALRLNGVATVLPLYATVLSFL